MASLAKRLGGIAGERELPRPARVPFVRWYERRLREQARLDEVDAAEAEELLGDEPVIEIPFGGSGFWKRRKRDVRGRPLRPEELADALAEMGSDVDFEAADDFEDDEDDEDYEAPTTVLLWTDTFTEYLSPSVGQAALRVLEAAGLHVIVPPRLWMKRKPAWVRRAEAGEEVDLTQLRLSRALFAMRKGRVCCGLTYISTGQLDGARAVLRRTLDILDVFLDPVPRRLLDEDPDLAPPPLPVVVLEPSCAATLRTDLPELLPDDPRAHRLAASVITFAEALERHAPHWTPPAVDRPVVGQTHCHQHAVLGDAPDRRLRTAAGLTGELSGGCCGLAGNFGFEKGHYEVSVACAEDQLLPAVTGRDRRHDRPGGRLLVPDTAGTAGGEAGAALGGGAGGGAGACGRNGRGVGGGGGGGGVVGHSLPVIASKNVRKGTFGNG